MNYLRQQLGSFVPVFRREIGAYYSTPMAYVFLAVFLLALGMFTWEASGFFDTGTADLSPFFVWHPWLYMIFLPALAMRLWADETSAGTDELLLSLPLGMPGLVLGKLLAAWSVAGVCLLLTFPMWLTVNFLGKPDNAAIILTYFVSFLMAGSYLSVGAAVSALTRSQVTAFVISVVIAFIFTAAGWPLVLSGVKSIFGAGFADLVAQFSFLSHFEAAQRGVLEFRAVLFFLGFMALWTILNGLWASRHRLG
ncbi:ABC transporter permease subunit [Hyphomonas pacifica]|uniref:ABC transporter permease n=1 Tax=Hyphomonas pacifica TaxID=1280941 RepID=A0A062TY09_9PROT|nr:ABC transporter permease subunit [Hyphomonas pacifica]KCZ46232.1 ABC transporter permease [Hyphomonas pacifica]RAN31491.1 ABC transporter permease [Hyphomonas pacifica]RAN35834.1 ABC transporter permease [Hyphomonas pacifica]